MPLQLPANIGTGTGTGGSAGSADTLLIAAADADPTIIAAAAYQCDGVNDEVQIVQALIDAQMCTSTTETFPGANFTGTIFASSTDIGTWAVVSNKAKATAGENGTNICRKMIQGFLKPDNPVIAGFDYACDITYQAGTAGILFDFSGVTTNSSIDGVAFVIDGTNAKLLEGSAQTLAASTTRATTAHSATAGTTKRLSLSYRGNNRFVAKIDGIVIHDTTIGSPTHDYTISYSGWGPLTFHSTTSNNTFDNFSYPTATGSRPVRLSPGRFKLAATVTANAKALNLSGAGRRDTIVDCTGLSAAAASFDLRGTNAVLRSFRNAGASADGTVNSANGAGGIVFQASTGRLQDLWFDNLNAVHTVSLASPTVNVAAEVRDCTFDNNGATSVAIYNSDSSSDYYVIEGCDFLGEGECLNLTGGNAGQRITNNRFCGTKGIGINISAGGDDGPLITGNYFAGGGTGIKLDSVFGATISGNQINQNFSSTAGPSHGIHLFKSDQNLITGNAIMWNDQHGVFIEGSSSNTVSGNAIAENGGDATHDNIRIATSADATPSTSNYNNIDGNTIRRSSPNDANAFYGNTPQYGIRITAGTGNKITNNDMYQSGFAGDLSDAGTSTATNATLATSSKTASYTLALVDAGTCVEMNVASANTLTVPPNSTVAFPVGTVVEIHQYGAGQTTLTPGAGVTIRADGAKLKLAAQYASSSIRKRATDEWVAAGDLSA